MSFESTLREERRRNAALRYLLEGVGDFEEPRLATSEAGEADAHWSGFAASTVLSNG